VAKIIVLGSGAMGLAAAHRALSCGHEVVLLEAAQDPGGMAAHFDFGGLSIERYYHFICKSDEPTFALAAELGIGNRIRWRATSMGYFIGNGLHRWGDPFSLLRFPHLSLAEKIRYGLLMFVSVKRKAWPALEHLTAREWIESWCGKRVYDKLWTPLFALKFYEYADSVSALWIWTRIHRLGRSRRSMLQEELGYLEGGSETLVNALVANIRERGGQIRLAEPATRVTCEDGRVTGVETAEGRYAADAVISTVPTPLVAKLVPDLPAENRRAYDKIVNIGVICVILKLKRSVTPHFWVNIVDDALPMPGIIEFSNLRPMPNGETIVYVPFYMPTTNPLWSRPDDVFIMESQKAIRRINTGLSETDFLDARVGRLPHAQPICPPGFQSMIPAVQTPIEGLQIADTCFYYPEDRGVAESVRLGRRMADDAVPSKG
jgi:protoporphyrinogen oxidase